MDDFIKVMKALSDPSRVKIIKMLEQRELCVCEIQEGLQLAQPTISKHLKILEGAGLVTFHKEAQWVIYRLKEGSPCPYASKLLECLGTWLKEDPWVCQISAKLPFIRREDLCK